MLERIKESWGEKYGEYYRGTGLSPEETLSWQNRLKAEFPHLFKHQIQGLLKDSSDPISSNSKTKHSKVWDMEKDRKVNYCFNTEKNYNENWQALKKLTDNDYKVKEAWNVQTLLKLPHIQRPSRILRITGNPLWVKTHSYTEWKKT